MSWALRRMGAQGNPQVVTTNLSVRSRGPADGASHAFPPHQDSPAPMRHDHPRPSVSMDLGPTGIQAGGFRIAYTSPSRRGQCVLTPDDVCLRHLALPGSPIRP